MHCTAAIPSACKHSSAYMLLQVLLSHCCPPPPWPADVGPLLGAPSQEDNDSPSETLVHCALVMGNMQLLEMVLRALPPSGAGSACWLF